MAKYKVISFNETMLNHQLQKVNDDGSLGSLVRVDLFVSDSFSDFKEVFPDNEFTSNEILFSKQIVGKIIEVEELHPLVFGGINVKLIKE